MPSPAYIFLDLNQWIYLARDYFGRSQTKGHSGIATALLHRVQNDEVRLPLGTVHFLEHLQNETPARRERLAEVFELYSQGWCFASWSDICRSEIQQGLSQVFRGIPPVRPQVFGRGFMFTASAGGREIVWKDRTRESIAFFSAVSAQPGALFDLLTTTIEANRRQQKVSTAKLSLDNAVAAEDLRLRRRECSRQEYRRAQYATAILEHERVICDQLALMQRSIHDFLALGERGLSLWSDIPSVDTDCELTAYRDRQWSRKIQPNDVRDLAQLAVAVPYCDAVVVEKFWKRAIAETGLGRKYGTEVFCDLAELAAYLQSKPRAKWASAAAK
ncbi:MAG: hypothetical protein JWN63_575 [Candidatus Acidoferrum typicum]|nr:hypothetical protein [Candidatus Acidoferrum typicum]